jgi:ubiquitin C-terminal hydrolase
MGTFPFHLYPKKANWGGFPAWVSQQSEKRERLVYFSDFNQILIIIHWNLLTIYCATLAMFRTSQQQDSHEFLNYILNSLAEILLEDKRKMSDKQGSDLAESVDGKSYNLCTDSTISKCSSTKTWIHELFEGELATEIRCLNCESTTQTRECFLDLSIDVEANSSIASCLWNFSQSEMLCQNNKFYCDTCGGLQEAERMYGFLCFHGSKFLDCLRVRDLYK